uniref:Uncharacterized protein n=1 Tax=Brassica campestris TaxID=3711 RepID=M4E739_BRACM
MLRETREDPQKASSSTSQQPSSDKKPEDAEIKPQVQITGGVAFEMTLWTRPSKETEAGGEDQAQGGQVQ